MRYFEALLLSTMFIGVVVVTSVYAGREWMRMEYEQQGMEVALDAVNAPQYSVIKVPTVERLEEVVLVSSVVPDNGTLAAANKNPLNVKTAKNNPWVGEIGVDEFGHAKFSSWEYGMRAAVLTLRSYALRHDINTIDGIVNRFAEGNRDEYKAFIAKRLGIGTDEAFDIIRRMPDLIRAMARFECGQTLPEELFAPYDILAKI